MIKKNVYYDYVSYNFKNERGYYLSDLPVQQVNRERKNQLLYKINSYNEYMYKFYKKKIIENIKLNSLKTLHKS